MKRGSRMTRKSKSKADKMREEIRNRAVSERLPEEENVLWVSSGSVMLNLACSDRWWGAFKTGTMVNLVGDSSSGKSISILSGLTAAMNDPAFSDYRFIYDDAEFADSFDHTKLFGEVFDKLIEQPGEKGPSTTIEQFYDYVMDACENDRPFIYVLDSFDAIDSDIEIAKEMENRKYRKEEKLNKIKGTFGATKQKKASQMFRHICSKLKQHKSLLIIISQTRDNLSAVGFATKYRAGGRALKFYASIEAWLAGGTALTKTVNDVVHKIGVDSIAKITKNKYSGKYKTVAFPIYYDYGIDDISSCLDFLTKNKWWKKKGARMIAEEFDVIFAKKKMVEYIEEKPERIVKLFNITQQCWDSVEASLKLGRKKVFVR